jgi:hypothetical protein
VPTLRELEAVFLSRYSSGEGRPHGSSFHEQGELRAGAQGLLFRCPRPGCTHSVIVWFADSGVPPEASPKFRWAAQGSSIDTLTLSPSINLDIPYIDEKGVSHAPSCRWHGFINGGVAK